MLYNYIKEHYKEAEPIFFSDLEREDITKSALNQQLKKLCGRHGRNSQSIYPFMELQEVMWICISESIRCLRLNIIMNWS